MTMNVQKAPTGARAYLMACALLEFVTFDQMAARLSPFNPNSWRRLNRDVSTSRPGKRCHYHRFGGRSHG
jgi:hypothetical protein